MRVALALTLLLTGCAAAPAPVTNVVLVYPTRTIIAKEPAFPDMCGEVTDCYYERPVYDGPI